MDQLKTFFLLALTLAIVLSCNKDEFSFENDIPDQTDNSDLSFRWVKDTGIVHPLIGIKLKEKLQNYIGTHYSLDSISERNSFLNTATLNWELASLAFNATQTIVYVPYESNSASELDAKLLIFFRNETILDAIIVEVKPESQAIENYANFNGSVVVSDLEGATISSLEFNETHLCSMTGYKNTVSITCDVVGINLPPCVNCYGTYTVSACGYYIPTPEQPFPVYEYITLDFSNCQWHDFSNWHAPHGMNPSTPIGTVIIIPPNNSGSSGGGSINFSDLFGDWNGSNNLENYLYSHLSNCGFQSVNSYANLLASYPYFAASIINYLNTPTTGGTTNCDNASIIWEVMLLLDEQSNNGICIENFNDTEIINLALYFQQIDLLDNEWDFSPPIEDWLKCNPATLLEVWIHWLNYGDTEEFEKNSLRTILIGMLPGIIDEEVDWLVNHNVELTTILSIRNDYPIESIIYFVWAISHDLINLNDLLEGYKEFDPNSFPEEGNETEADEQEVELINNGIEIHSFHAVDPDLGITPGNKIANTIYRHPHDPPYDNAPDLDFGYDGNELLLSPDRLINPPNAPPVFINGNIRLITEPDDELFTRLENLITFFSKNNSVGENLGLNIFIPRFRNSIGTPLENLELNDLVMNTNEMKNTVKKFGEILNNELKNQTGNIDINSVPEIIIPEIDIPCFCSGEHWRKTGLKILMNDTEQTNFYSQSFDFNPTTGEWTGVFLVEVWDHFGLDDKDLKKFQSYPLVGEGFASWWILQHKKNYKPFRTKIRNIYTIKGNINN